LLKYLIIYLLFLIFSNISFAQVLQEEVIQNKWYVNASLGLQMSGIKDEDFVSTNYTPLFNAAIGNHLSDIMALQIGYKGFFFNYIDDNYKHYYYYLYIETVFNPITAFISSGVNRDWNILPHIGIGIFNNNFLHKSQACLNLGIQCNYSISHNFDISLDVSSIVGWRIYQKDEDIIPGIIVGITYSFL